MPRTDWHGHAITKPDSIFFQDTQQQVDQAAAVERLLIREAIDDLRAQLDQDKKELLIIAAGSSYTFAFFAS